MIYMYDLCGSVLLASAETPDSSVGLSDGEACFIATENAFPLLRSPMPESFAPLKWLVFGCSAMETHFMKLLTNSSCADVAPRGLLEVGSEG
jgi:hypothetical protein